MIKPRIVKVIIISAVLALAGVIGVAIAVGPVIEVHSPSVRIGTGTAGIFFDLHNHGIVGDCIIGVEVSGDGRVFKAEMHRTEISHDVAKMVMIDRVCIGPMSEVSFRGMEGEGYHIMVMGDVSSVDHFDVTLKFESGRSLTFKVIAGGVGSGFSNHVGHE